MMTVLFVLLVYLLGIGALAIGIAFCYVTFRVVLMIAAGLINLIRR